MTSPEGGFYSAQDADSEGVEGKFFVWRPEEVDAVLGRCEAEVVCDYYGVTNHGKLRGNVNTQCSARPCPCCRQTLD